MDGLGWSLVTIFNRVRLTPRYNECCTYCYGMECMTNHCEQDEGFVYVVLVMYVASAGGIRSLWNKGIIIVYLGSRK